MKKIIYTIICVGCLQTGFSQSAYVFFGPGVSIQQGGDFTSMAIIGDPISGVYRDSNYTVYIGMLGLLQPSLTPTDVEEVLPDKVTSFKVFPSPFRDELTVDLNLKNQNSINVRVYDQMGIEVYATDADEKLREHRLNLVFPTLPVGVYYLRISDTRGQVLATTTLLKQ